MVFWNEDLNYIYRKVENSVLRSTSVLAPECLKKLFGIKPPAAEMILDGISGELAKPLGSGGRKLVVDPWSHGICLKNMLKFHENGRLDNFTPSICFGFKDSLAHQLLSLGMSNYISAVSICWQSAVTVFPRFGVGLDQQHYDVQAPFIGYRFLVVFEGMENGTRDLFRFHIFATMMVGDGLDDRWNLWVERCLTRRGNTILMGVSLACEEGLVLCLAAKQMSCPCWIDVQQDRTNTGNICFGDVSTYYKSIQKLLYIIQTNLWHSMAIIGMTHMYLWLGWPLNGLRYATFLGLQRSSSYVLPSDRAGLNPRAAKLWRWHRIFKNCRKLTTLLSFFACL